VRFEPLGIEGAFRVESAPVCDERGSFARTFCARELAQRGLDARVYQVSVSVNRVRGTLRGMHYAARRVGEAKLVRCTHGRIYDVILDLRADSATARRWVAEELSRENGRALYIPPGVAHGFLTLDDDAEVLYQMTTPHDPAAARGVRYDDPLFGIRWPACPAVISARDESYADFAG